MNIILSRDGIQFTSGWLSIDPPSFTPEGGFTAPANISHWSSAPGGATDFNFQVNAGQPNGGFPTGVNGNQFTYNFTGHENPNGNNPSGHVTWPPSIEGGDPVTWQGEATAGDDEPYSRTQGAS